MHFLFPAHSISDLDMCQVTTNLARSVKWELATSMQLIYNTVITESVLTALQISSCFGTIELCEVWFNSSVNHSSY